MLNQFLAVLLVLGLLAALLWAARKKGMASISLRFPTSQTTRVRSMRVLERLPLTAQHSLHLVQISDRLLLIGVSPGGCTQLDALGMAANKDMESAA